MIVGTSGQDELHRLLSAFGGLGTVRRCLIAVDGSAGPQLLGTAGVAISAEAMIAAAASTAGRLWMDVGWLAPIVVDGERVGAVLVDCADADNTRQTSAALADAAASVIRHAVAELDHVKALRALVDVAKQLHAAEVDAERVLEFIVEQAHELVGADATWLALADVEHNVSRPVAVRGARTPGLLALRVELGQGVNQMTLAAGDVVLISDENHTDPRLPAHARDVLSDEGIVSLVGAALVHHDDVIGNLLVGFRRNTALPQDVKYLLGALSSQAALTIANSRLYESLRAQNDLLRRHSELSALLTESSLAGGDQHTIATDLARALGSDVIVERCDEPASVWRYSASESAPRAAVTDTPDTSARADIRVGGERVGWLYLARAEPHTDFDMAALTIGAAAIALELTKQRAAMEAEWRVSGELLEELLRAGGRYSESVQRRARQAGFDVTARSVVAVVEARPGADPAAAWALFRAAGTAAGILVGTRGERILVALPHDRDPRGWLQQLVDRARSKEIALVAGLSESHADLGHALTEAMAAVKLAAEGNQSAIVVDAAALGPLRILLDAADTSQMVDLVRRTLGPLADYDRRRHSDLLATLRAFLDAGGNHPLTAERSNVHLNTVKYRLGRAAEVLDRQFADPATRFEFSLAFAVCDVLDDLGISPWAFSDD
ncbi:GAF domain-containing protein [Gordonia sp. TBRC 11910]|uniref:GAF domain-containing protein n=1 Tax=Gordonia asplenii TaxID=2725283 RepID=A0A848KQ24_9ACTN|nr:helix-turn-helix domain-containing protein [Gordonia asplenii]NMO01114.1 GAF domain-containing protein [Gordonia asplenii]